MLRIAFMIVCLLFFVRCCDFMESVTIDGVKVKSIQEKKGDAEQSPTASPMIEVEPYRYRPYTYTHKT